MSLPYPPPPPPPRCLPQQSMQRPRSQPNIEDSCAEWRSNACCTPVAVRSMILNLRQSLFSASAVCKPLLTGRACAETCDPRAASWQFVGVNPSRPKLCRPFCERYFEACLATGDADDGSGGLGEFSDASTYCETYGATTRCLDVPVPSPPQLPPAPVSPPSDPYSPPPPPPPGVLDLDHLPEWAWLLLCMGVLCVLCGMLRLLYYYDSRCRAKHRAKHAAQASAQAEAEAVVVAEAVAAASAGGLQTHWGFGFDGVEDCCGLGSACTASAGTPLSARSFTATWSPAARSEAASWPQCSTQRDCAAGGLTTQRDYAAGGLTTARGVTTARTSHCGSATPPGGLSARGLASGGLPTNFTDRSRPGTGRSSHLREPEFLRAARAATAPEHRMHPPAPPLSNLPAPRPLATPLTLPDPMPLPPVGHPCYLGHTPRYAYNPAVGAAASAGLDPALMGVPHVMLSALPGMRALSGMVPPYAAADVPAYAGCNPYVDGGARDAGGRLATARSHGSGSSSVGDDGESTVDVESTVDGCSTVDGESTFDGVLGGGGVLGGRGGRLSFSAGRAGKFETRGQPAGCGQLPSMAPNSTQAFCARHTPLCVPLPTTLEEPSEQAHMQQLPPGTPPESAPRGSPSGDSPRRDLPSTYHSGVWPSPCMSPCTSAPGPAANPEEGQGGGDVGSDSSEDPWPDLLRLRAPEAEAAPNNAVQQRL